MAPLFKFVYFSGPPSWDAEKRQYIKEAFHKLKLMKAGWQRPVALRTIGKKRAACCSLFLLFGGIMVIFLREKIVNCPQCGEKLEDAWLVPKEECGIERTSEEEPPHKDVQFCKNCRFTAVLHLD